MNENRRNLLTEELKNFYEEKTAEERKQILIGIAVDNFMQNMEKDVYAAAVILKMQIINIKETYNE